MDTTQLIAALNARRTFLGITQQQLADMMHKDVTSVSKQLSPSTTGMQLATLLEYAEALDGTIEFITAETMSALNEGRLQSVRIRMIELGSENEDLRKQLNEKNEKYNRLENQYMETADQLKRLTDEYISLVRKLADKL